MNLGDGMRLYSIYEIEKLSKKRLTKYRILSAIQEGSLKAMPMQTERRGRGAPKFLIPQEALVAYLHALKAEARRADALSNDAINDILLAITQDHISEELVSDSTLDTLIERLQVLEQKNAAMEPFMRQGLQWMTDEQNRSKRRKQLLQYLSETEWYEFEKRQALLAQLNALM